MGALTNTWQAVRNFCDPLGNFASVAGLFISIVGFIWTIAGVITAKRAAGAAEAAAREAKKTMLRSEAVAKFSDALSLMEHLKPLHRSKDWPNLLDRYAQLKRVMIELQSAAVGLSAEENAALGGVISQLSLIEKKIEGTFSGGKPEPEVSKTIGVISDQITKIHTLSVKYKLQ